MPKSSSFFGTIAAAFVDGARAAVFGAPHGTPYPSIDNRVHAGAPHAFRAALGEDSAWLSHYDWDFEDQLLPRGFRAVDLGDVKTVPKDGPKNRVKIETTVRGILAAGAVPLMFGGDDSTPIPFLAGFAGAPKVTILQVDAHIDWRDEREGEAFGFSSTMRRASEMPHVAGIVQVGARGIGSARHQEVDAARAWGAELVPMRQFHRDGAEAVLRHIGHDAHVVICLDLDVLDSSVMPAVAYPSPGGMSFVQLTELLAAVAAHARVAGFAMVEFVPKRDPSGMAAFAAGRIAAHVLGHVARQGTAETA